MNQPPSRTDRSPSPADRAAVDRLLGALFPPPPEQGQPGIDLYAVLDGARDARIYPAVYESRLDRECLFSGDIPHDLAEAAPYLVRLSREAPFSRWLLEEGFGRSFGIFAWARADMETLRRHFRRILQVRGEGGKRLFFRYYDPRVLRVYLPTCSLSDLREVFGPLSRLFAEGPRRELVSYAIGSASLRAETLIPA